VRFSAKSAISMAVCIIPNFSHLFNKDTTFLKKLATNYTNFLDADFAPLENRRHVSNGANTDLMYKNHNNSVFLVKKGKKVPFECAGGYH